MKNQEYIILIFLFLFGNLSAQVTTTYEYDNKGQLLKTIYHNGTEVIRTYDQVGNPVSKVISNNCNIQTSLSITPNYCSTGNGNVTVVSSGGVSPYTYSWSTGASTNSIPYPASGNYTVSITDANGCTVTQAVTVSNNTSNLTLSISKTNQSCQNQNDGTITVTPLGGAAPYTYQWSSNQPNTNSLSNLSPGYYAVTVTDANGCTKTISTNIFGVTGITITPSTYNTSCPNSTAGSIVLSVNGGTAPYTYTWSSGATSQNRYNLGAGLYNVTVTDANGCTATSNNLTIGINNSAPTASFNHNINGSTVNVFNQSTNATSTLVNFGNGSWQWVSSQATTNHTYSQAGTYNLCVTAYGTCGNTTNCQSITINPTTSSSCLMVTNTNDAGTGSLREAINCANSNLGPDTIKFNILGSVPHTIYLQSRLPYLTDNGTVIDATSQNDWELGDIVIDTAQYVYNLMRVYGNNIEIKGILFKGSFSALSYQLSASFGKVTETGFLGASLEIKGNDCIVENSKFGYLNGVYNPIASFINGNNHVIKNNHFVASNASSALDLSNTANINIEDNLFGFNIPNYLNVTPKTGLRLSSNNHHIYIKNNQFSGNQTGIFIYGTSWGTCSNIYIQRNIIGLDKTGTIAVGNQTGIFIYGTQSTFIGGHRSSEANVISGNTYGIRAIQVYDIDTVIVQGNYIGTDFSGTTTIPNFSAIYMSCKYSLIGGDLPVYSNIISGNTYGITVGGTSLNNNLINSDKIQIKNNFIGTDLSGTIDLGNYRGISGASVDRLEIGGNTLAYNDYAIRFYSGVIDTNTIRHNSFYCNNTGLNLTTSSTIPGNPIITSSSQTNIIGTACSNCTIDVYLSDNTGCSTAPCQGTTLLQTTTANSIGNWSITGTFNVGDVITALATNSQNNTSEFAPCTAISVPCIMAILTSVTPVSCQGEVNGAVTLTINGGQAPYTFQWSNNSHQQNLSNLAGGTYYVTVTDLYGCTKATFATISEPANINLIATSTDASCTGASDGTSSVTASGGNGGFTYQWNDLLQQTTSNISSLSGGVYTVTATDASGCLAVAGVVVNEPTPLQTSVNKSDVTCFAMNNGVVNLTISGGSPPYSVNGVPIVGNNYTTNNLSGGQVTLTVTDNNACSINQNVTILEPAPIGMNILNSNMVSCHGMNDAFITIGAVGGNGNFSYLWSNGVNTATNSNLTAGLYGITATDNKGCNASSNITITEPSQLNASVFAISNHNGTVISCVGMSDGALAAIGNGGTAPYSYLWSNGVTTSTNNNLAAGTYTVTITDANNCMDTQSFTISTTPITVSESIQHVACAGQSQGAITITPTGGSGSFNYTWSNGGTTSTISNLAAGTYTVTITDANNCTKVSTYQVNENPVLTSSISSFTNNTCYGDANGSTNLSVTGGVMPYSFNWNNGQTTEDISNLVNGMYTVIITDAVGCNFYDTVIISSPSTISNQTTIVDISCNGANDGNITIQPAGGVGNYTYSWSNGGTTATISGLSGGTYDVTITDGNGCVYTESHTVNEPPLLVTNITYQNPNCPGESTGSIQLTPTGGSGGNYSYAWSNSTNTTSSLNNLTSGPYTVTVTDATGCSVINNITLIDPVPLSTTAQLVIPSCQDATNGSIDISIIGGLNPYTTNWDNGATTEDITNIGEGTYIVNIMDALGCILVDTFTLLIQNPLNATLSIQHPTCNDTDGNITPTAIGGVGAYTYAWSNGTAQPTASGLIAGVYTVTITDNVNCSVMVTDTLISTNPVSISSTVQDVLCNSENNGAINITTQNTSGTVSYQWSNNTSNQNLINVGAGIYTVTLTDAIGCTETQTDTITEPTVLNLPLPTITNACTGSNGSITTNVVGGTNPYAYQWSDGITTANRSNLSSGIYVLTVTDANSCTLTSDTIIIEGSPVGAITYVQLDSVHYQFFSNAQGNSSNYLWDFGDGNTSTLPNPIHAYNNPINLINVSLAVSNTCGIHLSNLDVVFTKLCCPSSALQLFPNPNSGQFKIEGSNIPSGIWKINLIAANGQQLYLQTETISNNQMDLDIQLPSTLASGYYVIELVSEEGRIAKRFILRK